jgi:hypothetical protein
MKYCHFSGNFQMRPARLVFDQPGKEIPKEAGGELSEAAKSEAELRSQYESAKSEVEERLKKYEKKLNYKVFVDYAKGRLALCDKDLKKTDVLDVKKVKANLVLLNQIIFQAAKDEVNDKKNEVVAAVSARKKEYLEMLDKRFEEQKRQLGNMPDTLVLAKQLHGNTLLKIGTLFNERVRKVSQWVTKMMGASRDADGLTDSTFPYLDAAKEELTSTIVNSMNMEAKKLYDDYNEQVTGEYLHEKARGGKLEDEISLVCAEYFIEKGKNGKPHLENAEFYKDLKDLRDGYIRDVKACKGSSSYKQAAVVYGDFLNEYHELRNYYFPDEKVKGAADYQAAALARTNAIRTQGEKGWEKLSAVQVVAFHDGYNGVLKNDISLHIGPENPELAGVIIDVVKAGTKVKVAEGAPVVVKKLEYSRVQVLDDKGKVVNEGWVPSQIIATKFGTKSEKAVEHKGAGTI